MDAQKRAAIAAIDAAAQNICAVSDAIWETPELGFREHESARLQCELLQQLGFAVERQVGNIPTAFAGRFGSGKPIVGILGEFDALPGLSQKAGSEVHDPVVPGAPGHGCGHNLLGCGSIAAAYAIKEYLKETGKSGTVIYYGCPAEEGGSGKAFMARDGVFDELDFAFGWHPAYHNKVGNNSSLANYCVRYKFKGISAHAAAAPHLGRSALDAVELMNVGVQFLREHVPASVRIHYAITNTGGEAPGVVQARSEVYYMIRAEKIATVESVYKRVNKIAQGAAMMTETEVDIQLEKACSDLLIHQHLNDVLQANMEQIPLYDLTEAELAFAQTMRDATGKKSNPSAGYLKYLPTDQADWVREQPQVPVCNFVVPRIHHVGVDSASGDIGDVSYVCPTAEIYTATWAAGTDAHTWLATAQGKSGLAHKAMLFAGKVLAGAAIDLLVDPEKLAKAKAEHEELVGHKPFVSPIPKDVPLPKG
jgi:aminobenzoyl-glutamate utilization protein B